MEIRPQSEFNPDKPEVGFYNLPESVYRVAPGENWSCMKSIGRTPKKYKWRKEHPRKETDALKFGRLWHTVVLEKDLLYKRYIEFPETYPAKGKKKADPDVDKPWNMNAAYCRVWVAENIGRGVECVKRADINYAKAMSREMWELSDAKAMLEDADGYEVSGFWKDEKSGLLCKLRLDALKFGQIGDLKKVTATAGGAEWEAFCRAVRNLQYYGQAAFYRDGTNAILKHLGEPLPELPFFRWLVVEDEPPYDTAIYTIFDHPEAESYQWFVAGRELYELYLWQINLWREKDVWPSHNHGPSLQTEDHELTLPDWLRLGVVK